ncbi:MAG: phospholipid-binding protein MlaC [Alphaproteobacteria bacterium]
MKFIAVLRALGAAVLVLFAGLGDAGSARADLIAQGPGEASQTVVSELIDRILDSLKPDIARAEREKRFEQILRDGFHVPAIARFCAGTAWDKATEAERASYLEVFPEFLVKSYSARFGIMYQGEKFKIVGTRADGKDGIWVKSHLLSVDLAEESIPVEWRMRLIDGKAWRAIDVVVEGVSMVVTQRDDFAGILRANSDRIQYLVEVLRAKVKTLGG